MAEQRRVVESGYQDAFRAMRRIWRQRALPTDARLFIAGAVYQAGVRQGDEVFPREIFEKLLAGQQLDKSELLEIVEGVHEFTFVKGKLRPQYLVVVLAMTTRYLDRMATALLADKAKMN